MKSVFVVFRRLLILAAVLAPAPAFAQAEIVEYYGLDAVGSVRIVFDISGGVIGRMDYGPFGEALSSEVGMPSRAYAGLFRDAEAGLDYAEARSYQSRTGRFSRPDPLQAGLYRPQRWNLYAYGLNNPMVYSDATGLMADSGYRSGLQSRMCGAEFDFDQCGGKTMFWDTPMGGGFEFGGDYARAQASGYVPGMPDDMWSSYDAHNRLVDAAFENNRASVSTSEEYTLEQAHALAVAGGMALLDSPMIGPADFAAIIFLLGVAIDHVISATDNGNQGARAPGRPGPQDGFIEGKDKGPWVRGPRESGYGWRDKHGAVWIPTGHRPVSHGGPHWDVQYPGRGGRYVNVYPGGRRR